MYKVRYKISVIQKNDTSLGAHHGSIPTFMSAIFEFHKYGLHNLAKIHMWRIVTYPLARLKLGRRPWAFPFSQRGCVLLVLESNASVRRVYYSLNSDILSMGTECNPFRAAQATIFCTPAPKSAPLGGDVTKTRGRFPHPHQCYPKHSQFFFLNRM
jgi:hypothetical protein